MRKGNFLVLSMIISLTSILLCIVCLVGLSWAWFIAYQTVSTTNISASKIKIETLTVREMRAGSTNLMQSEEEVVEEDKTWYTLIEPEFINGEEEEKKEASQYDELAPSIESEILTDYYKFEVKENTVYEVTATVTGSAEIGFLIVNTPDGHYYTPNIKEEVTFSMLFSKAGTVTIGISWGNQFGKNALLFSSDMVLIGNGVTVSSEMPSQSECMMTLTETSSESEESTMPSEVETIPQTAEAVSAVQEILEETLSENSTQIESVSETAEEVSSETEVVTEMEITDECVLTTVIPTEVLTGAPTETVIIIVPTESVIEVESIVEIEATTEALIAELPSS